MKGIFQRTELLVGSDGMKEIKDAKIIIFGIGGVGSWCAESLIRNGVKYLTIVDSDTVCVTNINRQLMATTKTVGKVKTDALKERLLEINPNAEINAVQRIYEADNSASFQLEKYDYIIDAIDSLGNKIHLLNTASRTNAVLFCSLGAALKIDPTKIRVGNFWKVHGCPLGSILRKRMRQRKQMPKGDFLCVYSDEVLENQGENTVDCGNGKCLSAPEQSDDNENEDIYNEWCGKKAVTNGTSPYITAIFGFTLAGLVIKDIMEKKKIFK
ncbi:MAG: tRNA threonylcarbamoyladenosine dehydratase [Bacteroidales bacterium]|nr:tRNA threonylcarbamoyladenosine dehydratase [Bacteroidales bacterium]